MDAKTRGTCRVCGSKKLVPVLSLGEQFVTNFVEESDARGGKGPLELVLCDAGNGCGLLQLKHTFDHEILYRRYWYKSGISTSMVKSLKDVASAGEKLLRLCEGDIVVDIGSNDGTLLRQYSAPGLVTVGFEPSNLFKLGIEGTAKIIHDYFNHKAYQKEFGNKQARLITSIAMFYDLEDPNTFVEDVRKCLREDGLWIIQMNYLALMLKNNTFDNISHEHLEYYSLMSLEYLLKKHGMEAFDVELNDVNGGSFRIYIKHDDSKLRFPKGAKERLRKLRAHEKQMELDKIETYEAFGARIEAIKNSLMTFLNQETEKGKKVFIYGASTRGLVVLQLFGIDNYLIEAATDKNPDKWGKFIVGTCIPIISIEEYRKQKPDYLLVLPYHLINEIRKQEEGFLDSGGKMIVTIPRFEVITKHKS